MVRVVVAGLLLAGSAATVALGLQVAQELIEPGASPALIADTRFAAGYAGSAEATGKGVGSYSPGIPLVSGTEPKLVAAPVLVRGEQPLKSTSTPRGADVATVYRDATPLLRPSASNNSRGGDRYERARQLQRELARVGCYVGDTDGDWGGASKRAMAAFLSRVNAVLPVDEPDPVLIALVESHAAMACGNGCRPGEVLGLNGHCLPTGTITARQEAPASVSGGIWRTDVVATPMEPAQGQAMAGSVLPGRMALGATGEPSPASAAVAVAPTSVPPAAVVKSTPSPTRKKKSGEPAWARSVFPEIYGYR